jgi:chromosomal replication initiation ATPase DnaA
MTPEAREMFTLGTKILRQAARMQNERPTPRRTMASIVSEMAGQHRACMDALKGPSRKQSHFQPRAKAMLAMYREGYSYPQIGRFFNRDHSSVMHACDRASTWERIGK